MKVKYFDLINKKIFISGGADGIGSSIVEHFCEQGAEVIFIDINEKKAKELISKNIEGIIVGKAIYDGDIKLEELVKELNA